MRDWHAIIQDMACIFSSILRLYINTYIFISALYILLFGFFFILQTNENIIEKIVISDYFNIVYLIYF